MRFEAGVRRGAGYAPPLHAEAQSPGDGRWVVVAVSRGSKVSSSAAFLGLALLKSLGWEG